MKKGYSKFMNKRKEEIRMKKNSKNKRSGYRNPATMQGASYAPSQDAAVQGAGDADTSAQEAANVDETVQNTGNTERPAERIILQFENNEISMTEITEKVKKSFLDISKDTEIKEMDIYVKPADNRAYYVINGEIEGSVELSEN